MIVAIGCDHGGFPLKQAVTDKIKALGFEVLDFGTDSAESVDYPDYAVQVSKAVLSGKAERGILICGSGVGVCITANKFKGIYASVAHDVYTAAQGVTHDNMNILCLGGRVISPSQAVKLTEAFLTATAKGQEDRHLRRINKVLEVERKNFK
ncbi:MAG: ribose 5-phosphate isomerase B [Elusimicrobiaceae bacterium]|nr:ribose 5-phosphate isomerase B [Elusimicrobiaceae bacterium]